MNEQKLLKKIELAARYIEQEIPVWKEQGSNYICATPDLVIINGKSVSSANEGLSELNKHHKKSIVVFNDNKLAATSITEILDQVFALEFELAKIDNIDNYEHQT